MFRIILGIFLFIGGIGNFPSDLGPFFTGIILGSLLIYSGFKKKGWLPNFQKKSNNMAIMPKYSLPPRYIVFDIETTGFSRTNDHIIEIAATEYVDGRPTKTFHRYVNPRKHIPSGITRLTGVRNSDVSNAPIISAIKWDVVNFFGSAPLVGHNIRAFDLPFLETQLNYHFQNPLIDTLQLSQKVFPGLPNYKLPTLNHILGLANLEHHRAENDIIINNALLLACSMPQKYMQRIKDPYILNSIPIEKRDLFVKPDIHDFSPVNPIAASVGPLAGKYIVFSGEFNILPEEAYQIAVDAGAILKSNVSKKVDYLVQGYVDPQFLDENGWSNKQRTARKLIESGEGKVKIISETEFLKLASPVPNK